MTKDVHDDEVRQVKTSIDSFGFRNDEEAGLRDIDLIVLGDSFGFGGGITQKKTFASLLSDRFGLATYNLSLPHDGPWAEFVNFTLESKRLRMRRGTIVLWVLFSGNDLADPYGLLDVEQLPRNGFFGRTWISLLTLRNRSPIYQMLRQARYRLTGTTFPGAVNVVRRNFINDNQILFAEPYAKASRRSYLDVMADPHYDALGKTVTAMKKLTDKLDVSIKVVVIPTKEEVYAWVLDKSTPWSTSPVPSGFSIAVQEIADDNGIEFLDLMPSFVVESRKYFEGSGKLLWWYDDTHWNEYGHDLAATIIHDRLLVSENASIQSARPNK